MEMQNDARSRAQRSSHAGPRITPEGTHEFAIVAVNTWGDLSKRLFCAELALQSTSRQWPPAILALVYSGDARKNEHTDRVLMRLAESCRDGTESTEQYGFVWEDSAQNMGDFFEQFVRQPRLVVRAEAEHRYDVRLQFKGAPRPETRRNLSKEDYERLISTLPSSASYRAYAKARIVPDSICAPHHSCAPGSSRAQEDSPAAIAA